MKKNAHLSFAIIFLILGIVVSMQYKSTQKNKVVLEQEGKTVQEVQAQLLRQKEYSEELSSNIREYQEKIEKYENNIDVEETIKADLEEARIIAGLIDVKGKGIIITVDDTKVSNNLKGIVPNSDGFVVSDNNLLEIINELRAAGAQAISINEERVTATTEIRKSGSFIRINNKNYNRPFVIKAIGEPSVLEGSLRIMEGIIEYLTINNVDVSIKRDDNVVVPKYGGIINHQYLNKI